MKFPLLRFQVQGRSMLPAYHEHDRVLVYRYGKIRPGDVVVFERDGNALLKRVYECTDEGFFVRGDSILESTDSVEFGFVLPNQIIGRVVFRYAWTHNSEVDGF